MINKDVVIVGAGFAGAVMAERFASLGKRVLVIEKRNHIAGNMYDYIDENQVRRHEYGPHIFHTNHKVVVDYLSNFTDWYDYKHCVLGHMQGVVCPIPFNFESIDINFDKEKASRLKTLLIEAYGEGNQVPILKLRENENDEIKELAEYIFENIFLHYTMKQWGLNPEEIDPAVTGRVPVRLSYDNGYFADAFQIMPKEGYTSIFERMLTHENIEVCLNTEAKTRLQMDMVNNTVLFDGKQFDGLVIYTGAVDDLFDYKLGDLPYRSLDFDVQSHDGNYQKVATENYPTPKEENAFTRITEYKFLMEDYPKEKTTIAVEYPLPYDKNASKGNIPYYPIFTEENQKKYEEYLQLLKPFKNFYLLGRLAEYKYYNMDALIERALKLFDEIK